MRPEVLSLVIILTWASVLTCLERLYPYQKGYKIFRKGYWMDLFWYTLVQNYFLGIVIAFICRTLDNSAGISRLHLISDWTIFRQFLLFFVTHEVWQYWFHRIEHRNKYFWRVHEAAHATPEVDWLVGSRSHAFEILIAQSFEYAPIILLGAKPEIAILKATVDAVWGMFNHSNIKVNMSWAIYFFNGPQLHRWHHAMNLPADKRGGVNFATKLSVQDWLFGTGYLPAADILPEYGIRGGEDYPSYSYFKQLYLIFRPFKNRKIKN